jgi:hypothetical protein
MAKPSMVESAPFGFESPFLHEDILATEQPADPLTEFGLEAVIDGEEDIQAAENIEDTENPVAFERENGDSLDPADAVDELAAQGVFADAIKDRVGPLLGLKAARDAATWNAARHPSKSGIAPAVLLGRLGKYVSRANLDTAIANDAALSAVASDESIVLALAADQFQQKVYAPGSGRSGRLDEATLDALGFVRHRDRRLNAADASNIAFHVKGRSTAFKRLEEAYAADRQVFAELGSDVTARTWFSLFVNPPFLGRPFNRGVQLEMMRRLRRAERWLVARPAYAGMTPAEIGTALGIDENHAGGRPKNNASMHTLGLAVDIGYLKNPWVSSQVGSDGKPNARKNSVFQAVSRRVSHLMAGDDLVLTPRWLSGLGGRDTAAAYDAIRSRHDHLVRYLTLDKRPQELRTLIEERQRGASPGRVIGPRESLDSAVARWTRTIRADRAAMQMVVDSKRVPANGFLNLHRDLVVALRDHGCLAWGAVDLGSNQSGDMMHFDCRAQGIGFTLSLPRQRTVGPDHPCTVTAAPDREEDQETNHVVLEETGAGETVDDETEWVVDEESFEDMESVEAPVSAFLGGRLWAFTSRTIPMRVGIFVPKAVVAGSPVDVLVYAHGHLSPCPPIPKAMPEDLIIRKSFELGRLVHASNRQIVLVVPAMEWSGFVKAKLSVEACDRAMHALGVPANLNGVVAEVLAEIGRVSAAAAPALKGLIVSGHSRAFDFLNLLALSHYEPAISQGALGKLSDVWLFDTTYLAHTAEWMKLMAAKPSLRVAVFYRPGTGTARGQRFERFVAGSGGRLSVVRAPESHCQVPVRRLPPLLSPAVLPTSPEVADEAGDAFAIEPASEDTESHECTCRH